MTHEELQQAWEAGAITPLAAPAEAESLAVALGGAAAPRVLAQLARHHGPGVIVGSGGSQGGRRWCLQPLAHLQASAWACGAWLSAVGIDPATCLHLNPLPLNHVSGLMPLVRCHQWGARHRALAPSLLRNPLALVEAVPPACLAAEGAVVISLVPTQLRRLLACPAALPWLQEMAVIWVGGAPLPQELAAVARDRGLRLAPCYGATETAAMVAALPPQHFLAGEGSCGQPLADVALRIDAASGALEIATDRLASGWLNQGQLLPLPRSVDGWWRSGDAARLHVGELQILGRLDGAIHSGGETVFPEQVEQRLLDQLVRAALPVAELLLLSEPDTLWGERLVALFRPTAAVDTALLEGLEAAARQLPPSQRPRRWLPCPPLQRSDLGKWERPRWHQWLQSQPSLTAVEPHSRGLKLPTSN
jgi:O-succinylbenzoic acid--CoA ligase